MKTLLASFLCVAILLPAMAQTPASKDAAYQNQQKASQQLADLLFPDASNPESDLAKKEAELDAVLKKNQSALYYYSGKPIVLGFEAAGILRAKVHWENVASQQTAVVIDVLSYALICTKDFKKGDSTAATGVPTVGPDGSASIPLGIQVVQPSSQESTNSPTAKSGSGDK